MEKTCMKRCIPCLLLPFLAVLCLSASSFAFDADPHRRGTVDHEAGKTVLRQAVAALKEQADNPDDVQQPDSVDLEDAAEKESLPKDEAPAANADQKDSPSPPTVVYRQQPLHTGAIRAPRLGRPSANPLENDSKRSIRDAVTRPVEFGEQGLGFKPPDWTEPLRDIEADFVKSDLISGETVLKDNVRLRLGEMHFSADEFRYQESAGNYQAAGNVLVEQHESRITAGKITYMAPAPEVVERTFILEPGFTEQQFAKKRLSMGRLLAEQLHVTEPTRELYADYVDYDFASQKGELRNARGLAAVFFYEAEHVRILGPDDAILDNLWITTCAKDPPHYRVRVKQLTIKGGEAVSAKGARLQIGKLKTPVLVPFWKGGSEQPWTLDFDSGRRAEIGYFANVGAQFEVNPRVSVGPRIMPTQKQGIGLGGDLYYNYMNDPASYLYRTQGEAHVLYTTKDRGHGRLRHRYEYDNDLVLRVEAEQWTDSDFYKDFFYEEYRNRTTPRTYANVVYRQQDYIATATTRLNTHSWIPETERLPEGTFHLIERPVLHGLHASYDVVAGYNRRKQRDLESARLVNVGRLTYDWNLHPAIGITPFYEVEGSWYQRLANTDDSGSRFSNSVGLTLQTRFHKTYPGFWGFSGFKHVILPSVTYSYRPSSTIAAEEAPRFDALDGVYGRSRIESKISNVFYGRDAETNEVWQVGRLTLYQGNDFYNEARKADDYEIEIDVRPRSWWGAQLVGERHVISNEARLRESRYFERLFYKTYERLFKKPYSEEASELNALYADYNRVLTQLYYDDTLLGGRFSSRIGFAYTDTDGRVYNRELLYGLGYKISEHWGLGFEHIYNLKDGELRSQTYEVRRRFDCWETALRFRDRESGFDVNVELSLVAFPGSAIKF